MKVGNTKVMAALLATGLFAFSSAAMATNGYFTHGVGTESKGMGGAGVGSPENLGGISIATNPALAVFADEKWQIGFSVFSPMRSYEARGGVGGHQPVGRVRAHGSPRGRHGDGGAAADPWSPAASGGRRGKPCRRAAVHREGQRRRLNVLPTWHWPVPR